MFRRTLAWLLPTGLIALFSAAFFNQTRGYALLGWDAYPIVLTSRVDSLGALFGTFGDRLMDGRYAGAFYRPLFELTIALDHALWGLEPFGYQLTNVLWLAAAAAALYLLARRLLGESAWIGPLTTLLVFFCSSYQWEVLPVAPRRPELMSATFMAWLLARELLPAPRRSWIGWLLAAAAMLSKETAFVIPGLVAVLHYAQAEGDWRERARKALPATLPFVLLAAVLLFVRFAVLGGIGGPEQAAAAPAVGNALFFVFKSLLLPQPAMQTAAGTIFAVSVSIAAAVAAGWLRSGRPSGGRLLLPLAWIVAPTLLYSMGSIEAWYLWGAMCGWALLAGCAVELLYDRLDTDRTARFATAAIALGALSLLLLWQSSYSPLVRHYGSWERASDAARSFLAESERLLAQAENDTFVTAPPLPTATRRVEGEPTIRGAHILADYSVQAWVELRFPGRRIRVLTVPPGRPVGIREDEVVYGIRLNTTP